MRSPGDERRTDKHEPKPPEVISKHFYFKSLFTPPQKDMGQYSNHKKEIQTQESNVSRTDTYKKLGVVQGVSKQDLQQLLMSLCKSHTCLLIQYIQTPGSGTNLQGQPNTHPSIPRKIPKHTQSAFVLFISKHLSLLPPHPQTLPPHLRLACKSILTI